MRLNLPRSFVRNFMGGLLVVTLLSFLGLAACFGFGSSDSEDVAEAVATTPAPAPTAAPTNTPNASAASPTSSSAQAAPAQAAAQPDAEVKNFHIDPAQSEARFIVDEVLFGNPNTVTGRTNELTGTLAIDVNNPANTTVSAIQINARALATDNRFRNRSLNRLILQSNQDQYQYITFTPTAITGLPAAVKAGDAFSFQITGDLKIRDAVQPVTFDVSVTADSDTQISGLAKTVVQRSAFNLNIPKVEGVADVTEEVHLELQFVATAGE
jgi:polyisoprenoid-binding protein YceI